MKKNLLSLLKYFLLFFISILFMEIVMRLQMGTGLKLENFCYLWFLPAESLFFAMLSGFATKKTLINRIVTPVILFLVTFYYAAQLIYYRNFGSLFSIAMAGMGGDAIGNFWWALKDTLLASIGLIIVLFIPLIVTIVLSVINKPKWNGYNVLFHAASLFLVVALWFAGIAGLRIGGNERQSAYYLFFNTLADTDSVATKFGAMTTTILEAGSYYFGVGNETSTLATVDTGAAMLGKKDTSSSNRVSRTNAASSNQVSENVVSENEAEFIPIPRVNENIDFNILKNTASDAGTQSMCDFFASRDCTSTNEFTGIFKDYNLIYICAESFDTYALDPNVNPTLYKMATNGIVLNHFYNSFKNTTTNGEFAFATSLWPDVSRRADCGTDVGSFPQSASKFMPMGLADNLNDAGYETFAYHNYYGEYYRRALSWPNLGYQNLKFTGKGMHFTCNWPASDYEMMQQSVDDYIEKDKFHAYYMTFSGHGPYTSSNGMYNRNIGDVRANLGERQLDDNAKGYLAGNHELDKAMDYLLTKLEEAGKLDNTVIVICGDHAPYYMSDAGLNSIAGHVVDKNFELYQSTCIIYNAGMEEPIESDTYCCNVDILPTILNLLGVDYDSRLYMGVDIFDENVVHKAMLYNRSFVTELVQYNSTNGNAEWTEEASQYTEDELNQYLDAMIKLCDSEYEASTSIINNNFYKFVWLGSGLMTAEEEQAEASRAYQVEQMAQSINYKNAQAQAQKEAEAEAKAQEENKAAAAAKGWTYDPVTGYAYDASGVVYNPNTGAVVGNLSDFLNNNKQPAADPNAAQPAADPNAAQPAADPNAAQPAADPNAAQPAVDPNAVAPAQ